MAPGFFVCIMNSQRISIAAALLALCGAAVYLVWNSPGTVQPRPVETRPAGTDTSPPLPPLLARDTPASAPAQMGANGTLLANSLELGHDLRATYDRFKDSKNAFERHTAYRAWSACFPTFIAPKGQALSIDSLTSAMSPNDPQGSARIDAYRSLQARCRNFSDMPREAILAQTQQLQEAAASGSVLSPGELASRYLSDGDKQEALRVARAILASRDPYAISSLSEFVNQYMVLQVDAQSERSAERPDLRSLAFTLAACQMGLECGAASLTALRMCAASGTCSGSVPDRYLEGLPTQADRDAVQAETARVLDAIRSGNLQALGL